jgi:predicted metalloprotease with PDZ domain
MASAAEPIHYELGFERPNTHLMNVTVRLSALTGATFDLAMPDWAPGAYSIRNYADNVQAFRAADSSGRALPWRKTDSQTWNIDLKGSTSVTVHYQVFNGQYNDHHVSFTGPSAWMYLVNGKDRSADLKLDRSALPANWKIATGMKKTGPTAYSADDYDTFADCPIEISDYGERVFDALGTTYHIVVDPKEEQDFDKFTADLKKVVEAVVPIFAPAVGGNRAAPFAEYFFLMHINPGGGAAGGVEHLNSTMITMNSGWSDHASTTGQYLTDIYTLKLFVAAHEFFHAWNVKRLRPRELGPFDYSKTVHTPSLWISEGLTSYYAAIALERAGFLPPQKYLDYIGRLWAGLEEKPGRKERSIADTSWDTWFGGAAGAGRGGVNTALQNNLANTNYSYYDGGQTLGTLLDMEIRQHTQNRKSLDDWMRLLYTRYALPKPGFEPNDAVRAASEVAGVDMSGFFEKYVTGKDPMPYERDFAYAGIQVITNARPQPWLGAVLQSDSAGRAAVMNVIPGSPAEEGGLDRGDIVIAVDGQAADRSGIEKSLASRHNGDQLTLTVTHLGQLKQIQVKLTINPYPTFTLKPVENPTDLQRTIYKSYLGIP